MPMTKRKGLLGFSEDSLRAQSSHLYMHWLLCCSAILP